jgi:GT2 family glycosyltransferase
MAQPRVLFAITVYNGAAFVPDCLRSAAAMRPVETEIDILVLDDASPEPGFSDMIESLCRDLGIDYYRTPRNLGIPRNVNMGLLRAMDAEYDYVVIANSDVCFAEHLTDTLVATALSDPLIGSVTSWSNNVSLYSLPNSDPDRYLGDQDTVSWLARLLEGTFGTRAIDVPAGISFAILLPVPVLRKVGLMDPVFGRGYCEETDWSLRSLEMGFRVVLAPGAFTYHQGGGANVAAGLVSAGHTTVPENEAIIDMRWPEFRLQVATFEGRGELNEARVTATEAIMRDAAGRLGYVVTMGGSAEDVELDVPIVELRSRAEGLVPVAHYLGFTCSLHIEGEMTEAITSWFGRPPSEVRIFEPSATMHDLAAGFAARGSIIDRHVSYPTSV